MSTAREYDFERVVAASGRVGVLMGGASAEREISLRSGEAVTRALAAVGVDVEAVDWNGRIEDGDDWHRFDRYFIALHGRGGEDGGIQSVLELMGIPYTGSRVLGCALSMDKVRAKLVWSGAGLPTPPFEVLDEGFDAAAVVSRLGLPLMVKPSREGSSLGASKVKSHAELGNAFEHARSFDRTVLAERWIEGGEYTLAVVGDTALPLIKLETPREFYDYEAKYVADTTRYLCPCGLEETVERAVSRVALDAFAALDAYGWGRVDFMLDHDGRVWLIELNTVPGMTDHSLVPMAARHAGWSFEELVVAILASSF